MSHFSNLEFQPEYIKLKNFIINPKNPSLYLGIELVHFGANVELFMLVKKIKGGDLHTFRIKCLDFYVEVANQIRFRFDFDSEVLRFHWFQLHMDSLFCAIQI
ncbi:hypothetical protein ILUMI_11677 [Ignelater luminosus]|uniref:Uncharacterized protein n=1 Tax=Ignelater luminosus TaxID=2038154 RepID=A0A8K0GA92_IGNLU|nr:hypothetical protein ILUMI_11677 [Ignelater luminosus]